MRVFVAAVGVLSAAGSGIDSIGAAMESKRHPLRELSLWATPNGKPALVGEVEGLDRLSAELPDRFIDADPPLPRTHILALLAARQTMGKVSTPPDAIVVGVTTGGMPTTEKLLKAQESDPSLYRWHGLGTVTDIVADLVDCRGPALTISTACSSGTAAIILALELIRSGKAKHVLAGGVDGLCRMTYYGFSMLQLVDPLGCRPMDAERKGMTVSEGAAMLYLSGGDSPPPGAVGEIAGGALTCDAHHPTAPHPLGEGAAAAMRNALRASSIHLGDVDYINLHGTGTPDNDLSEGRAISAVFGKEHPKLSSTKGIFGHCLAASGGVEAVVALDAIRRKRIPPNLGVKQLDPEPGIVPVTEPETAEIRTVLSNSLGFGGNNASVVVRVVRVMDAPSPSSGAPSPSSGGSDVNAPSPSSGDSYVGAPSPSSGGSYVGAPSPHILAVRGYSCLSGSGSTENTIESFLASKSCAGRMATKEIGSHLPPRKLRRLGRLSRTALHLASTATATENTNVGGEIGGGENVAEDAVDAVFWATGNGPLSETFNFLKKLYASNEQFSSPVDFSGSVHNAPAGLIAIHCNARGPNLTTTGKTDSFEQALFAAQLFAAQGQMDGKQMLVIGADEAHDEFSPMLDPSLQGELSDGGGALLLAPSTPRSEELSGRDASLAVKIDVRFLGAAGVPGETMELLVEQLGGTELFAKRFGVLYVGLPAEERNLAEKQLERLLSITNFTGQIVDYRKLLGEYPTVSAAATAAAVELVKRTAQNPSKPTSEIESVIILGLGNRVSAVEVFSEKP